MSTGMRQRLNQLRGTVQTQPDGERYQSDVVSSVPSVASPDRSRWHVCLEGMKLVELTDIDHPDASQTQFRVSGDGRVWHLVTPELLGWMLARIEIGLRAPAASEDLGAAIVLFHRARDASGFAPGLVPSSAWVPPGYGLRFPDLSDPFTGLYSVAQAGRIERLKAWRGKAVTQATSAAESD